MGLGKTLSTIAFLHTVMKMIPTSLQKALVVVPSNVLCNWKVEIKNWTKPTGNRLVIRDYSGSKDRENVMDDWKDFGGVLLMTHNLFSHESSQKLLLSCPPDLFVLDEAHLMLKNPSTSASKDLHNISTKRKILLTGTPLQNSVNEYFYLAKYACPEILDNMSSRKFQKKYRCVGIFFAS